MRLRNTLPAYRLHKQSGQAIVSLSDGLGGRKDYLLGPHGTPESRRKYDRLVAKWVANGRTFRSKKSGGPTVEDLILRFWAHVEEHYRDADGAPTSEVSDYRLSLRPLNFLFGKTRAKRFGPPDLEAVRNLMVGGYNHPKYGEQPPLARKVVNQRVARIKRAFKWAVAKQLVPSRVWHALLALEGLKQHRSKARETEPVRPVPVEVVNATLPHLLPIVRDMVDLQLLTGCRGGELVIMRGCDIDMSPGDTWVYRPRKHKTLHHGHGRSIVVGPRAQGIIRRHLKPDDAEAYLFSPAIAREQQDAERRSNRKSPMTPSQRARQQKRKPKRTPGERYTVQSYYRAICRGCEKAWPLPERLAPKEGESWRAWRRRLTTEERKAVREWHAAHRWHPHQLRHTRATELRRVAGLDTTRAILGHRTPTITEQYAELDLQKAVEVMRQVG